MGQQRASRKRKPSPRPRSLNGARTLGTSAWQLTIWAPSICTFYKQGGGTPTTISVREISPASAVRSGELNALAGPLNQAIQRLVGERASASLGTLAVPLPSNGPAAVKPPPATLGRRRGRAPGDSSTPGNHFEGMLGADRPPFGRPSGSVSRHMSVKRPSCPCASLEELTPPAGAPYAVSLLLGESAAIQGAVLNGGIL